MLAVVLRSAERIFGRHVLGTRGDARPWPSISRTLEPSSRVCNSSRVIGLRSSLPAATAVSEAAGQTRRTSAMVSSRAVSSSDKRGQAGSAEIRDLDHHRLHDKPDGQCKTESAGISTMTARRTRRSSRAGNEEGAGLPPTAARASDLDRESTKACNRQNRNRGEKHQDGHREPRRRVKRSSRAGILPGGRAAAP